MLGHKLALCWSGSSCNAFETLSKWKSLFRKQFHLAGWKLRCPTGVCAGPWIFVSVLSIVLKFTSQRMFLYVKRWEGNGFNWCSGGRLGVKKEWFQGSLSVKSFNYTAKFMLEQSNVNMFRPPSTFIRANRWTNHSANTWMQASWDRSTTPEALMRPRKAQRQRKGMNNNTYTQKLTTAEQKIWRNTEKVKCHCVATR